MIPWSQMWSVSVLWVRSLHLCNWGIFSSRWTIGSCWMDYLRHVVFLLTSSTQYALLLTSWIRCVEVACFLAFQRRCRVVTSIVHVPVHSWVCYVYWYCLFLNLVYILPNSICHTVFKNRFLWITDWEGCWMKWLRPWRDWGKSQ